MNSKKNENKKSSLTYWIWSGVPPLVALLIAQAASLLTSNSPLASNSIIGGKSEASKTAWICSALPAVMLLRVQQASFLRARLGWFNKEMKLRRRPWDSTTWVCWSSPVTMLPRVLKAGVRTEQTERPARRWVWNSRCKWIEHNEWKNEERTKERNKANR